VNSAGNGWTNAAPSGGASLTPPVVIPTSGGAAPPILTAKYTPFTAQGNWLLQLGAGGTPVSGNALDCSNGIFCAAGTSANDCAVWIMNDEASITWLQIVGTGSGYLGVNANDNAYPGFKWTDSDWSIGAVMGGVSVVADATGTLTVSGLGNAQLFFDVDGSGFVGSASGQALSYFNWNPGPVTQGSWNIHSASVAIFTQPALAGTTATPPHFSLVLAGTSGSSISAMPTNTAICCNMDTATIPAATGVTSVQFPALVSGSTGTTASTANAYLDAAHNNNLLRSTSARRFKTDVREIWYETAQMMLAKLRPVFYRSLCAADDPEKQHIGLIAEDVAEVCPELVTYDADGRPANVQYEKLAVLLLAAHGA
jgi:hypothetical protein